MRGMNRKLFREVGAHKAEAVAVIIIIALGTMIPAALLLSNRTMRSYLAGIYEQTRFEDFIAEVQPSSGAAVDSVRSLDNVKAAEGAYSREVLGNVRGTPVTLLVVSIPDGKRPAVNDLQLKKGTLPRPGGNDAVAEFHLAGGYSLVPGEKITVAGSGGSQKLTLSGVALSPRFLRLTGGAQELAPDPRLYGIIFVNASTAGRLFGTGGKINIIAATVKDQSRLDATVAEAARSLAPYGLVSIVKGTDTSSVDWTQFDLNNMQTIATFFAMLILLVAALAIYTAMTRMVVSEQQQVGAARAIGYRRGAIVRHYLAFAGILGLAGAVLGMVLGYLFSRYFLGVLSNAIGLPAPTQYPLHITTVIAVMAVAVLFALAGAAVPAWRSARLRPAESMRLEAGLTLEPVRRRPKSAGKASKMPGWFQLSWRNISRSKKRAALTFFGMVFTLAALLTTVGYIDCVHNAVNKDLNRVMKWGAVAAFAEPQVQATLRAAAAIDGVTRVEPMIVTGALLEKGGRSMDIELQAMEKNTAFHDSFPTSGSQSRAGPGEILLNRSVLGSLPLKKGDRVRVTTPVGSVPMTVAGFVSEPFGKVGYVDLAWVQSLAGNVFNTVVVGVAPGKDAGVEAGLRALPGVSKVTTHQNMKATIDSLMKTVTSFISIIYFLMLAIAFAIVFTMVTVNTMERRQEIATMRTLGAGRWKVFGSLSMETATIALLSIIPGVALGLFFEWLLIAKLTAVKLFAIDVYFSAASGVIMVSLFLGAVLIAGLLPFRQMWHMDLARVVKERSG